MSNVPFQVKIKKRFKKNKQTDMDKFETLPENDAPGMTSVHVVSETEPTTSNEADEGVKNKLLGASALDSTSSSNTECSTKMEPEDQGKSNLPTQMDGRHRPRSVRTSRSSHRSCTSCLSSTKGNIAALQIKIKDEAIQRQHEEELEELERQHQRQQQEQAKEIARKRRELEAMKTKSALRQEQARLAAEESDDSQDLGSDDDDFEPANDVTKATQPRNREDDLKTAKKEERPASETSANPPSSDLLALANAIMASRLPVAEPSVFYGDPLLYLDWIASFNALIESKMIPAADKIYYLGRYLSGDAKEAVKGYFTTRNEEGYKKAKEVLEQRFGNKSIIAEALKSKLMTWPKVDKPQTLRKFSDFINQVQAASSSVKGLSTLNDPETIYNVANKLPDDLNFRWRRHCTKFMEDEDDIPTFEQFAKFVFKESERANNPVINRELLSTTCTSFMHSHSAQAHISLFAQVEESTPKPEDAGHLEKAKVIRQEKTKECAYCFSKSHYLPTCPTFRHQLDIDARLEFLKSQKRCLKCFRKNHSDLVHSKCRRPHDCLICKQQHPTSLHDYFTEHERERHDEKTANITTSKDSRTQATCHRIIVNHYKVQPQTNDKLKTSKQHESQSFMNNARTACLQKRNKNKAKVDQKRHYKHQEKRDTEPTDIEI